jgi:hypothetical protein
MEPGSGDTSLSADLQQRLARAEAELAVARRARAEADQRAGWALALFAAVSRLYEAHAPGEVYTALEEIAAAVLGCHDLAVYLIDDRTLRLCPVHTCGPRARSAREALLGEGTIGRAVAERRTIIGAAGEPAELVVAAPLGAIPQTPGALVLYGVAGTPAPLTAENLQLLEIVGRHAGISLAIFGDGTLSGRTHR